MREGCMLMIISNIGRGAEQNMQEPAGTVRRLDASIQPALAGKPQKQAPASEINPIVNLGRVASRERKGYIAVLACYAVFRDRDRVA
eukprot:856004-Pelagomonas_calceolata.AAC.4